MFLPNGLVIFQRISQFRCDNIIGGHQAYLRYIKIEYLQISSINELITDTELDHRIHDEN